MKTPGDDHRVTVLGQTGAGKSQLAIYLLSTRSFDKMPWVIIDYKGEDLIRDILLDVGGWRQYSRKGRMYVEPTLNARIKELKVTDKPPKKPGLYIMHPRPQFDDEDVKRFLYGCWEKGKIGLFIDEGFALPQDRRSPMDLIMTQGRTRKIPVIALYQRPVWMSRFVVSQSDFFAIFFCGDEDDRKTLRRFATAVAHTPEGNFTVMDTLPKYHAFWQSVSDHEAIILQPAPSREEIIAKFRARLMSSKRTLI